MMSVPGTHAPKRTQLDHSDPVDAGGMIILINSNGRLMGSTRNKIRFAGQSPLAIRNAGPSVGYN